MSEVNKTHIELICPKCGQNYLFWLFGRTACACSNRSPVSWELKEEKHE